MYSKQNKAFLFLGVLLNSDHWKWVELKFKLVPQAWELQCRSVQRRLLITGMLLFWKHVIIFENRCFLLLWKLGPSCWALLTTVCMLTPFSVLSNFLEIALLDIETLANKVKTYLFWIDGYMDIYHIMLLVPM